MLIDLKTHSLHVIDEGPRTGAPVVLLHGLGTTSRLFDDMVDEMPMGLRIIRPNFRGHGASTMPKGKTSMGGLVRDIEQVLDQLIIQDAVVVGHGLGGMVAQALAVKRLDLMRAMVLINSASRLGVASQWERLLSDLSTQGHKAYVAASTALWFTKDWRETGQGRTWTEGFAAMDTDTIAAVISAISGTDLYRPTSGLRLPTLGIAGSSDRAIPPDMTRETVDLVPGSQFALLQKSGHLTPADQPAKTAEVLTAFLKQIGHITVT